MPRSKHTRKTASTAKGRPPAGPSRSQREIAEPPPARVGPSARGRGVCAGDEAAAALWLAAIVESSDDAIISKDLDGVIMTWNRGAERLFGYSAEEAVGKSVILLIPPDRHHEEPAILARLRRGERIDHYETVRRRKDGTLLNISLTVSPVKDADGRILGVSKIARDITERKRAQEQQTLLFNEMRHRIKNSLAVVQAIAMRTLPSATAAERQAFVERLQALASAHDLLSLENWDRAPLRGVVEQAFEPIQKSHGGRIDIEARGDVTLDASTAMLLAMLLHELITNAIKYGALSNEGGRVHVAWDIERDTDSVTLRWRETGGPQVKPPAREGFGSLLFERALGELGKIDVEFDPAGLMCKIAIPVRTAGPR
jgi:PAS domain S-box-containing protein